MIIDELLDRINDKRTLNVEYIKKQSMLFEFEYILTPILNQDKHELKKALKQYIIENEYNTELLKDIDNLNISFLDNETAQNQIIEQIETTLFYTDKLKNKIIDILEDLEQPDFNEFVELFNFDVEYNDHDDSTKWELLKNYTSIDQLNQINTDNILQEFYNDIKKCFECVGV
jgi:hypothetical protein